MTRDTGQPPMLHKGCNSSSCCSPAKLWRTLQSLVKGDDKKELIRFFKDERLEHIVRVALTSRITNDAALFPPSQQHKVIRLTSRESMLCLGKSFTDLNLLQLALITSSESMVLTLLAQLKLYASPTKLKQFVNHVWGQRNTSLHLAVFLKRHLVVRALLDLGCASDALNARKKQAVDCNYGDQATLLDLFLCHNNKKVQTVLVLDRPPPLQSQPQPQQEQVHTRMEDEIVRPTVPEMLPLLLSPIKMDESKVPAAFFLSSTFSLSFVQPHHQCLISLDQLKKPPDIATAGDYAVAA